MSSFEHTIPGDYQIRALRTGWPLQRAWHRARLDLIDEVLPPTNRGLVLDAASGSGIVTWRFPDPRIVSADMRVSACAAVRSHTAGARAVAAMVGALPFGSQTFAQVYLLEVLEHLNADEGTRALRELLRVCEPGATCLLTTPNYRSHWRLIEAFLDRSGLTPALADAQHVSRYDKDSLRRAAEAAGWTVSRIGSFNLVAPLAGALSPRAGAWMVRAEASYLRASGPLLFAVCRSD